MELLVYLLGPHRRHPRGWCGLKYKDFLNSFAIFQSPPARVVWIEIPIHGILFFLQNKVATREGGVD